MFIVTNGDGSVYEFDLDDLYGPVAVFDTLQEAQRVAGSELPQDAPLYYCQLSPVS